MASTALETALIMDKLKAGSRAPRRKRRSSRAPLKKKKKTTRRYTYQESENMPGMYMKVAKKGFLQTPAGRYVKATIANLQRYYPALEPGVEGPVGPFGNA